LDLKTDSERGLTLVDVFTELEAARAACQQTPSLANTVRVWDLRRDIAERICGGMLAAAPAASIAPATELRRLAGMPVARATVDAAALRLALESHRCILVKGLATPAQAAQMLDIARKTYDGYEQFDARIAASETPESSIYYRVPEPASKAAVDDRRYHRRYGGITVSDAPLAAFSLCEFYTEHPVLSAIAACLGFRPLLSAVKTVVRKGEPNSTVRHVFHQDGLFLHRRAINIWLALTPAGIDAPGLEILPRRIGFEPVGEPGSVLPYEVLCERAYETYGEDAFWRPCFQPGDAMIFDESCLHRTHATPMMTRDRFALESWFFAPGDALDRDMYYI
jgi:hypothetical protein